MVAASLASLPLGLGGTLSADGTGDPALGILISLALGIGPTYGLLASTSPLVQGWLARVGGIEASTALSVEPQIASSGAGPR